MTDWNKNALDYGIPQETSGAPDLFQKVDFISHAGLPLKWKIVMWYKKLLKVAKKMAC